MKNILGKLTSRKFLASFASAVAPIVLPLFGVPPELVKWAQASLMTYVVAEGAADGISRAKAPQEPAQ